MTIRSAPVIGALILLALSGSAQQPTGCEKLYSAQKFSTLVIALKPIVSLKDIDDQSFEVTYQEGYHKKKTIKLYLNRTGQTLRKYLQPGDLIRKLKGEYVVTIARQLNNAMDVQQFDLSCEN